MRPLAILRAGLVALVAALGMLAGAGAATAAPGVVPVDFAGKTHLDTVVSPLVLQDVGTVKGAPFGSGDITLIYTLHPKTGIATTTFTITNSSGTISGTCTSKYAVQKVTISFTGSAAITGGTGAYAGMRGRMLQFNALHSVTGRREGIAFSGRATTPKRAPVKVGLKIQSHMVSANGGTSFSDTGTATGAPVGSATVALQYRLFPSAGNAGIEITLTNGTGSMSGVCLCDFAKNGAHLDFEGPFVVTGGTGAYAGITGTGLTLRSKQTLTGSKAPIAISGVASKPA